MSEITTVEIDLAKNVFSVHGVDGHGKEVLRKTVSRARKTTATMPRRSAKQSVGPTCALCRSRAPSSRRYWCLHRVRSELVAARVGLINQVRSLLTEFSIVMPQGRFSFRHNVGVALGDARLPTVARQILHEVNQRIRVLDEDILSYDRRIEAMVRHSVLMRRIVAVCGVGLITASAIVASGGDAKLFRNGRKFAAWLGLVPRQYSTGGKTILGRITKRGVVYLRTLLVHGARSTLITLSRRTDRLSRWAAGLIERRGFKRTCVAMAAKNARIIWALLAKGNEFQLDRSAA